MAEKLYNLEGCHEGSGGVEGVASPERSIPEGSTPKGSSPEGCGLGFTFLVSGAEPTAAAAAEAQVRVVAESRGVWEGSERGRGGVPEGSSWAWRSLLQKAAMSYVAERATLVVFPALRFR